MDVGMTSYEEFGCGKIWGLGMGLALPRIPPLLETNNKLLRHSGLAKLLSAEDSSGRSFGKR